MSGSLEQVVIVDLSLRLEILVDDALHHLILFELVLLLLVHGNRVDLLVEFEQFLEIHLSILESVGVALIESHQILQEQSRMQNGWSMCLSMQFPQQFPVIPVPEDGLQRLELLDAWFG